MPRLIAAIVRHGDYQQLPDTPSAHQPFPLTELGRQQAGAAGEQLCHLLAQQNLQLCEQVDCSRLLRGWQTAEIILEGLRDRFGTTPELCPFDALAERSVGSAANLSSAKIEAVIREDPRYPPLPDDWKSNSHFRLPLQGAESLLEAGERVAAHLRARMEELAARGARDTLKLFIGHGAAFRHAAYHLGVLAFEDIRRLSMYHAQPVLLEYRPQGPWQHLAGEWKLRKRDGFTD